MPEAYAHSGGYGNLRSSATGGHALDSLIDQRARLGRSHDAELSQAVRAGDVRKDKIADVIAHARRKARQVGIAVKERGVILFLYGIEQWHDGADSG